MSQLRGFQEALKRVCFNATVDDADIALLDGDRERWLIYRGMVRTRLTRTLSGGLPRVAEAMEAAFDKEVSAFFASGAITSRYFRHAVDLFAAFLVPRVTSDPRLEALLWYDLALWEARDDVAELTDAVGAFDFDRPVVFNPTLRQARQTWDPTVSPARALDAPQLLLVWRKGETRRLGHALLPLWMGDVLARTQAGATPTEALLAMSEAGVITLDPAFLDALASHLTPLIEGGAIAGSAPHNT